jgi:hypothetical protein
VLVTLLFTILGFAVGGFLGIVSIVVMRTAHIPLNVLDALWFGALPGGALGCVVGLVVVSISEKRAPRAAL